MRDETAKKPAPAKKRPSCRRARAEKRDDWDSDGGRAWGAVVDGRSVMAPCWRKAIEGLVMIYEGRSGHGKPSRRGPSVN
jgi:hypothetical protein